MQMYEIRIDGVIGKEEGQLSAKAFREMLPQDNTTPIVVKLHTEGGDVFEGFAIYDALRQYPGPKKAVVESMAFSIGSFIPMAFDDVAITPNGYMMIHNPSWAMQGDESDFQKGAEILRNIKATMIARYAEKTGKSPEEISELCNQETYLDAKSAIQHGFANQITSQPVALKRPIANQHTVPHGVIVALSGAADIGNKQSQTKEKPMSDSPRVAASLKQIKAAFPKAKADFVIRCMEKEMTIEEVNASAMDEVQAENESLYAKVKAMEEELAAMKAAKAMEEPKPDAMDDDEEEVVGKAPSAAVAPVAKARRAPAISARVRWNEVIENYEKSGLSRLQSAQKACREHRDLHNELLAEANG
jgi:ATP-dependent protease ClpP protease subunit